MSVRTQSNQDSQLLLGMQNKSPTWGSCLAVSHKVKHVSFQWNQLHSYLFIQKKWKHIHKLSIAFLHISTNLIPFWNSLFPICSPDFHMYKYYAFSLFIYFWCGPFLKLGFPVGSDVKNPPAMRETWGRSLGWKGPLEESMAAHSSILAWRSPWTEELGGLQSMGLQRVGHNWVTKHSTAHF